MRVKKFNEKDKVVFNWQGSNLVGTIESVITSIGKARKYEIRGENGKLYPAIGVDTTIECPGKILSSLTEKFFNKIADEDGDN